MPRIFVSEPLLSGREREYVIDCLDRNQLSSVGPYVSRLEAEFSRFCFGDIPGFTAACMNGTSALHLALLALGVRPGDHVIVPALTYVATANTVSYCGGVPVFCDVDPDTWCLDPKAVERAIYNAKLARRPIVGMIPVHLYGVPANMGYLNDIAIANKMWIVEDAAQAHGATYRGIRVGGLSNVGTFSFYGNKIITSGEGGAVVSMNSELMDLIKLYRGQGMDPKRRYWHTVVGYNYRMTNIQAAIALGQLEQIHEHAQVRADIVALYNELIPSRFWRQVVPRDCVSANWMFSVVIPTGISRDRMMCDLEQAEIETRPVFPALTELPIYRQQTPTVAGDLSSRGINLPTHSAMTSSQVKRVCETFLALVGRYDS